MSIYRNIILVFAFGFTMCTAFEEEPPALPVQKKVVSTLPIGKVSKAKYGSSKEDYIKFYISTKLQSSQEVKNILLLFDSHGKTNELIQKYKSVADSMGFTIITCNQIKNNQPSEHYTLHYKQIKTRIQQLFTTNELTIYIYGFSGGGRIAYNQAAQDKEIDAIVSICAGIPFQAHVKTKCLAITKWMDFNFKEVINNALHSGQGFTTLIFDGQHEWLSPTELSNVQHQLEYQDTVSTIPSTNEKRFNQSQLISGGLLACSTPLLFSQEIAFTKNYLQELSKKLRKESFESQQLMFHLQKADTTFWKNKTKALLDTHALPSQDKYANIRLLQSMSIQSYYLNSTVFKNQNVVMMDKVSKNYVLIDRKNPDAYFFRAKYYSKKNDNEKAKATLLKAISYGLDKDKVQVDVDLQVFANDADVTNTFLSTNK